MKKVAKGKVSSFMPKEEIKTVPLEGTGKKTAFVPEKEQFVKFGESGDKPHNFKGTLTVDQKVLSSKNLLIPDVNNTRNIRLAMKNIAFISFSYDFVPTIKHRLMKKYKNAVLNVMFDKNEIYISIPKEANIKKLPISCLNDSYKSMDKILSLDIVPKEIIHLTAGIDTDPVRLRGEEVLVLLDTKKVLDECVFSLIEEDKSMLVNFAEVTEVIIAKNKVQFGLTFDKVTSDNEGTIVVDTSNIVVANLTYTLQEYKIGAEEATGTTVSFVRTPEILGANTANTVYSRNGSVMMKSPLIELKDLSANEIAVIEANGGKYTSLFTVAAMSPLGNLINPGNRKAVNLDQVKLVYSDYIVSEPLIYKDTSDKYYLCPYINALTAKFIFDTTNIHFNLNVATTADKISVVMETTI